MGEIYGTAWNKDFFISERGMYLLKTYRKMGVGVEEEVLRQTDRQAKED